MIAPEDTRTSVQNIELLSEPAVLCRKKAPLRKLMHAYCDRQGHPENSVIFLYDGDVQQPVIPLSAHS